MSNFIAPGVYVLERDFSDYVAALGTTAYGMVGTSKRGPLNVPTLITSTEQFIEIFGEPSVNHHAPYSAINYLARGNQLWFVRVARQFSNDAANIDAIGTPEADGGIYTVTLATGQGADFTTNDYIRIRETGKPTTVAKIASIDGDELTLASKLLAEYSASDESDSVVDISTNDIGATEAETFAYSRRGGSVYPLVHFKAKNSGDWANFGTRQGIEIVIEDGGQFANIDPVTGLTLSDAEGNPLRGVIPGSPSKDTVAELVALTSADNIVVNELRGVNYSAVFSQISSITGNGTTVTVTVASTANINAGDSVTISGLETATAYNGTFEVLTVPGATTLTFEDPHVTGLSETPSVDQALLINASSDHKGLVYRCTAVRDTGSSWTPSGVLTKRVRVLYQGRQVEMFDNIIGYDENSELFWDSVIGTPESPQSDYITVEYIGAGEQPINTFNRNRHPNNPRLLLGNSTSVKVNDSPNAGISLYPNGIGRNGDNPSSADFIGVVTEHGDRTGLQLFRQTEVLDINLLAVPGNTAASVVNEIIAICAERNDCLGLIDPPFGLSPQEVVDWHNGTGEWTGQHAAFTGSQAALYYPWVKQYDPYTNRDLWLPPSCFVPATIAYSDQVSEVWFAPAGITRGTIRGALDTEVRLARGDVDYFYGPGNGNAINPIQKFTRDGIVIYGQRTLQRFPSKLDRVNVRRLMFYIEKTIASSVRVLNFEQNDEILWGQWLAIVEPFLEQLKGRRALEWFAAVCNETTNTPSRRNNNELYTRVYVIPTGTAEKIVLDFTLFSSGANVEEIIARDNGQNLIF